eukprot:7687704-Alexandrium_andersonii.AAC.1
MSASLVGSEMCIRDRDTRPRSSAGSDGQWHEQPSADRRQQQGEQPTPVSYTHLTLPTICSV